jgi:hypothetical protein
MYPDEGGGCGSLPFHPTHIGAELLPQDLCVTGSDCREISTIVRTAAVSCLLRSSTCFFVRYPFRYPCFILCFGNLAVIEEFFDQKRGILQDKGEYTRFLDARSAFSSFSWASVSLRTTMIEETCLCFSSW